MRESEKGCGCYDGGGIESVAAVVEAEGDQAKQMMCCELCRPRCPSRPPCCSQLESGLIFLPSPPLSPSCPFPHSSGFRVVPALGCFLFLSLPSTFLLPAFLPVQHYCTSVHWCWSPLCVLILSASKSTRPLYRPPRQHASRPLSCSRDLHLSRLPRGACFGAILSLFRMHLPQR